ncbi:MAG: D-aminoacylase [Chloroflexi bacterium]|nr:D-aminoacylase [Chloroflexota bacterium]
MADLLIRGGTLVDGSGSPGVQADVAIRGDRVVAVGADAARDAAAHSETLDAGGLVVAPGFIDLHSHADHTLPTYPRATNSITQGVTTEVVGLCGFSVAPVAADPARAAQLRELAGGFGPYLEWNWHTYDDYLNQLESAAPAVNVAPLVGHHALRILAMGMEDRPPTPSELAVMRGALADALNHGAWGMSTGLVYAPGAYATRDELLDLGQELARVDGLYVSHLRDEADGLVGAIDEALSIGSQLGIRTQISHLKITARRNAGRIGGAISRLEEARQRGARVHADVYPYVAGSTYLHQVVPAWVKAGGLGPMVDRLRIQEQRQRIRHAIELDDGSWANHVAAAGGWHNILITSVQNPARRDAEGRRVAELASASGSDPLDYTLDLLIDDRGATTMVVFHMDEVDMRTALSWRWSAVGSDQLGVTGPAARVHPRAYGTFARVLGWGVRDAHLFPLETAVYRMTGLPAAILGLRDRGQLAPGAVADVVLLDPHAVADAATYEQPTLPARGIEHVLLAGEFAVESGTPARLDRGRVLRRG